MKEGEEFIVSCDGVSDLCKLSRYENDVAIALILEKDYQDTNLPIKIYLFQGLPKSDKLELIIQKAVELGVEGIIPVEMRRSIVKLDDKKKKEKTPRWQAIAESAAKQCKRNSIPKVYDVMPFNKAVDMAKDMDLFIVPYECKEGMLSTKNALSEIKAGYSVGIFIGPEGGFEDSEIQTAVTAGGITVSLGKRILRTETASITAIAMCMLYAEMNI